MPSALPSRMPSRMLSRQVSDPFFGDEGGVGNDRGQAMPYVEAGGGLSQGETAPLEAHVAYVVAKVFCTQHSKIGFPAFSEDKDLLGFYREAVEPNGSSVHAKVEFLPLDHLSREGGHLSASNVRASSTSLDRELARQSKSVFQRRAFASVDDLKAAALFYHVDKTGSSQMGDIDDDILESLVSGASDDISIDPNWVFPA